MFNRKWTQSYRKIHDTRNRNRKFGRVHGKKDELKSSFNDERKLKQKKRRLTIDWFFRPEGE